MTGVSATYDELADYLISGYWEDGGSSAHRWDTSGSNVITVNLTALGTEGRKLALWALQAWETVADLRFVTTTSAADITFDRSDTSGAYSQTWYSGAFSTHALINVPDWWINSYGTTIDSYSLQTFVHEIGHTLGLGHLGDYNGSARYTTDALFTLDSWQASIMSYFSQTENTAITASYAYDITPMMADILAVQRLYGASQTTAGNTVYGSGSALGTYLAQYFDALAAGGDASLVYGRPVAVTLADSGGFDTIDLSYSSANQRLSLVAGSYSDIAGKVGNLGIALGTEIEAAVTGAGHDTITGNASANEFHAGAGNDSLRAAAGDDLMFGDAGSDTLAGEAGNDSMYGGAGNDTYLVDDLLDMVSEAVSASDGADAGGSDTVQASVSYGLAGGGGGYVETLTLSGSADTGARGNALGNVITGNAGDNTLIGGEGADTLTGGAGHDVFVFNVALTSENADVITDFSVAEDTIRLDDAIFAALPMGWLADAAFCANSSGLATDALDRILYELDTGRLYYDADGTGAGARQLFATLAPWLSLGAADFIVL